MPKISNKGIQMPESPIRKLVPYAEGAKKRGTKVYPFKHWSTRY
jgi:aspartate aminotransferase